MLNSQVLDIYDTLDYPAGSAERIIKLFRSRGYDLDLGITEVSGKADTVFLKFFFPGTEGKHSGKTAPTLGVVGQLGGLGAMPSKIGIVSDGDGAIAALALALKLTDMRVRGVQLPGDIIVTTHICMSAPLWEKKPVPYMGLPVDMVTMNRNLVDPDMDAVISIDTTKGNRILCHKGIAITPTVKKGYILKVSEGLMTVLSNTTGEHPYVMPITTQDITTYHNGLSHLNSILQPATLTDAPVIGLAVTTQSMVPGCATGASSAGDIELAARFCLECAKVFPEERDLFYDDCEYQKFVQQYGDLSFLCKIAE